MRSRDNSGLVGCGSNSTDIVMNSFIYENKTEYGRKETEVISVNRKKW